MTNKSAQRLGPLRDTKARRCRVKGLNIGDWHARGNGGGLCFGLDAGGFGVAGDVTDGLLGDPETVSEGLCANAATLFCDDFCALFQRQSRLAFVRVFGVCSQYPFLNIKHTPFN